MRSDLSPQAGRGQANSAILFQELGLNRHQDAIGVAKNIVVPKPKHAIAVFSQATIAYHVRGRLVVLPAVNFDTSRLSRQTKSQM
jgi:hypothetical protein